MGERLEVSVDPISILGGQVNGLIRATIALAPNLLAGLLAVFLTWALSALISRLVRMALNRSHTRPSLRQAVVSMAKIAIWVLGISVTLTIVFPSLTPTKLLAGLGLGSIAVGLAFKDIFENFLAGLLILIRKPMRIGDDIECASTSGRVEGITIRDTYIRKRSGD